MAANINHNIDEYAASRLKLDAPVNVIVVDRGANVQLSRENEIPQAIPRSNFLNYYFMKLGY